MQWVSLILASVFEVTWAVAMKMSEGFSRLVPSAVTIAGYIASAVFLSMALKKIPLGTAYAMWTGVGIVGTTVFGVLLFGEALSAPQIACIVMIAAGIAGLKLLA